MNHPSPPGGLPLSAASGRGAGLAGADMPGAIGIDFRKAMRDHVELKKLFGAAIEQQFRLDVETISQDTACALGKWLHDDAPAAWRQLDEYRVCLDAHRAFHLEAGRVARAVNERVGFEAARMLALGGEYSAMSIELGVSLNRLMKAVKPLSMRR
jgi:methyl-accepting chemotaxis protein